MKTIMALHEPITIERLELGLVRVAFLMELHGAVLAPIFKRLERELATMRFNHDAVGRAKRLLEFLRTTIATQPCRG